MLRSNEKTIKLFDPSNVEEKKTENTGEIKNM